ncbi:MAG: hypothetical protein IT450_07440 [Phycisphaerales bacterium]|nr:hypothetical protein [Phycisphaerales bacterium]
MVRVDLDVEALVGQSADAIERLIQESGDQVAISFSLQDTYHSTSKHEIARSALKAWYVGERIAEFCHTIRTCDDEGAFGEGLFQFLADVSDRRGLAGFLAELAPAFDPNDLESEAEFGAEAEGWLEERGAAAARFPELERAYRIDAEQAAECGGCDECEEYDDE